MVIVCDHNYAYCAIVVCDLSDARRSHCVLRARDDLNSSCDAFYPHRLSFARKLLVGIVGFGSSHAQ